MPLYEQMKPEAFVDAITGDKREGRMFTEMTRRLLKEKRVSGFFLQGTPSQPSPAEWDAFHKAFAGKTEPKGNQPAMPWGDWLVESLFPKMLYADAGHSLRKMVKDPRSYEIAGFSGIGNYNNSFGRMARPRDEVPEGFLVFMLDRIAGKYGGMPLYWFDVEYPEWVCAPLSGRPDIPKTGRTSVSCVMNYGFHLLNGKLSITIGLRHLNWSHGWGDVYGAEAVLRAICKEAKCEPGLIYIFANSATMDEPKIAKAYLQERYHGV